MTKETPKAETFLLTDSTVQEPGKLIDGLIVSRLRMPANADEELGKLIDELNTGHPGTREWINNMLFFDESALSLEQSPEEQLAFQRLRDSCVSAGGWVIAERFDDHYDTKVGGFYSIATQSFDSNGKLHSGISLDIAGLREYPTSRRPSYIIDYNESGKHITVSEAEKMPELAHVLARLREREAAYETFLVQRGKM